MLTQPPENNAQSQISRDLNLLFAEVQRLLLDPQTRLDLENHPPFIAITQHLYLQCTALDPTQPTPATLPPNKLITWLENLLQDPQQRDRILTAIAENGSLETVNNFRAALANPTAPLLNATSTFAVEAAATNAFSPTASMTLGTASGFPVDHQAGTGATFSYDHSKLHFAGPANGSDFTVMYEEQPQPAPRSTVTPVARFEDFYDLQEEVGAGGMGTVYRALHREIDRYVAVKILNPEKLRDQDAILAEASKMQREVQISASLVDASFVSVHGTFLYTDPKKGPCLGFSMDYVEGAKTLSKILSWYKAEFLHGKPNEQNRRLLKEYLKLDGDPKKLSFAKVQSVLLERLAEICTNVGVMHNKNYIHRDLKPDNILVSSNGKFYLADAGLACEVEKEVDSPHAVARNAQRTILGTHGYMPPEQAWIDQDHGTFSDIYSLGMMLSEIIDGKLQRDPLPRDDWQDRSKALAEFRAIADGQVHRAARPGGWRWSAVTELYAQTKRFFRNHPRTETFGRIVGELRELLRFRFNDLEAIIHKATAHNGRERYASAQDLANELTAFARKEPIKAYQDQASATIKLLYGTISSVRRHTGMWLAGGVTSIAAIFGGSALVVNHYRGKEIEIQKATADKEASARIEKAEKLVASVEGERDPSLPPLMISNFRIAEFSQLTPSSLERIALEANKELNEARVAAATLAPDKLEKANQLSDILANEMTAREVDYSRFIEFKRSSNQVPAERDPYSDDAPDQVRDSILLKAFPDCESTLKNIRGDITWRVFDAHPATFTSDHIHAFKDTLNDLRITHEEKREYIESMRKLLMSKIKEYPHHYRHQQYVREGDAERVENLVRLVWELTGEEQHTPCTLVPMVNSLRAQRKLAAAEIGNEQVARLEQKLLRFEEQLRAAEPVSAADYYALGLVQAESFRYQESLVHFRKAHSIATEKLANGDEVFGEVLASGLREIEAARRLRTYEDALLRHAALDAIYKFAKDSYIVDHSFTKSRLKFAEAMTITDRIFFDPRINDVEKAKFYKDADLIFDELLSAEPKNTRFLIAAAALKRQQIYFEVNSDKFDEAEVTMNAAITLFDRAILLNPQDPKNYYSRLTLHGPNSDWSSLESDVRLMCYWYRFNDARHLDSLSDLPFEKLFSDDWPGANSIAGSMRGDYIQDIAKAYAQFINFISKSEHCATAIDRCISALEIAVKQDISTALGELKYLAIDSGIWDPVRAKYPERFEAIRETIHSSLTPTPSD